MNCGWPGCECTMTAEEKKAFAAQEAAAIAYADQREAEEAAAMPCGCGKCGGVAGGCEGTR